MAIDRRGLVLAITIAAALFAAIPAAAHAQSCSICANFATTYDLDGPGGVPAKTRMHSNLIANVPYVLDVDGNLPPLPLGLLPLLPGYEVRTNVQGLDAQKPTITVEKLLGTLPTLPLRIEVVTGNPAGFTTLGYDTLNAGAPKKFVAAVDLSNRDGDAATSQAFVDLTITNPAKRLTLVTEEFGGDPVGTRTDRQIRRLEFEGDGTTTRVPSKSVLDLTTTETTQHVLISRDLRTKLNFDVSEPGNGPRTTGTLNEMPSQIDLTIEDVDLNSDGEDDKRIDYVAATTSAKANVVTQTPGEKTDVTIDVLPSEAHLTYESPKEDAPLPKETKVTYDSNGRAERLNLTSTETTADGSHVLTADVRNLPEDIDRLSAIEPSTGNTELIYESDGRADEITVEDTTRAGKTLKRTKAHVVDLPADVKLIKTSEPGADHIEYVADGGAERADIETVEDADTGVSDTQDRKLTVELDSAPEGLPTIGEPLPKTVKVDAVKSAGEFHFDYEASGNIAKAVINGTNIKGLPARTRNLNIALEGIPKTIGLDTVKTETTTSEKAYHCPAGGSKECEDIPPDCDPNESPQPRECPPTKTTKTTDKSSDLEVTIGEGRLDSAAIQLTNLQGVDPERLPATLFGKPQDGVLTRDFANTDPLLDRNLVDVRLSQLAHALVHQHSFVKRITEDSTGLPLGGDSRNDMELVLDANAPNHVLGFDQEKKAAGAATTDVTTAFLAGIPGHAQLNTFTDGSTPKKTTVDWAATGGPVHGFCPSSGGDACSPDEARTAGFLYKESTRAADGTLVPGKELRLDPMPEHLRICRVEQSPSCTANLFDANINRLANGDSDDHDCFPAGCIDVDMPISPDKANAGSVLLFADVETQFDYFDGDTSIRLSPLTRYALQGHSEKYTCLEFFTCQRAYLAMDSNAADLEGDIVVGGSGTHFHFPLGWKADRHVWSAWKNSPTSGFVASAGPIECPDNTLVDAGEKDVTEQFCYGDVFGEGDFFDFDLF